MHCFVQCFVVFGKFVRFFACEQVQLGAQRFLEGFGFAELSSLVFAWPIFYLLWFDRRNFASNVTDLCFCECTLLYFLDNPTQSVRYWWYRKEALCVNNATISWYDFTCLRSNKSRVHSVWISPTFQWKKDVSSRNKLPSKSNSGRESLLPSIYRSGMKVKNSSGSDSVPQFSFIFVILWIEIFVRDANIFSQG